MPPAVGLGIAGAGLLGSAGAGIFGASKASKSARDARAQAQQFFEYAQGFRPDFYAPSTTSQRNLYRQIERQYNPAFQQQANEALTRQFNVQSEQQRQALDERLAGRGLLRSGIGAGQQTQFLTEQDRALQDALLNQNIAFQQQRQSALGQQLQAQQAALGNESDLYRLLLNFASGQQSAAGQQQMAAQQAQGQAFGAPFSALTQLGALGAAGGFQGFGGKPYIPPVNAGINNYRF